MGLSGLGSPTSRLGLSGLSSSVSWLGLRRLSSSASRLGLIELSSLTWRLGLSSATSGEASREASPWQQEDGQFDGWQMEWPFQGGNK